MDEVLDAIDVIGELGIGSILLRLLGVLCLLACLITVTVLDFAFIPIPLALAVIGLILLLIPGVLMSIAELAG